MIAKTFFLLCLVIGCLALRKPVVSHNSELDPIEEIMLSPATTQEKIEKYTQGMDISDDQRTVLTQYFENVTNPAEVKSFEQNIKSEVMGFEAQPNHLWSWPWQTDKPVTGGQSKVVTKWWALQVYVSHDLVQKITGGAGVIAAITAIGVSGPFAPVVAAAVAVYAFMDSGNGIILTFAAYMPPGVPTSQ